MIYYIADMHFGHENVIGFDARPFKNVDEMNNVLISNWNSKITADDFVYVLGDALWGKEEESIKILEQLNGHKHLIQGNHDKVHGRLRKYWDSIEQYAETEDGGYAVVLSHYPLMFYKNQRFGSIMLHGHVHKQYGNLIEQWKQEQIVLGIPSQIINVGCMMPYMNYTPRTLAEILLEYSADKYKNE